MRRAAPPGRNLECDLVRVSGVEDGLYRAHPLIGHGDALSPGPVVTGNEDLIAALLIRRVGDAIPHPAAPGRHDFIDSSGRDDHGLLPGRYVQSNQLRGAFVVSLE